MNYRTRPNEWGAASVGQITNLINHIAFVIDASSSMRPHVQTVPKVFDAEIAYLKRRSVELNQETRVSVYIFSDDVHCVVFDMDVMRVPSLQEYYNVFASTALLDGVGQAVEDMKKLPELYGDHAFLVYAVTDGEENVSRKFNRNFASFISGLPEHWTVACMVPDARGIHAAKGHGFPANSVMVWDTSSSKGVETVGKQFRSGMDAYMTNRAQGVRGTKSFFANTSGIKQSDVQRTLSEVTPGSVAVYRVRCDEAVQPFVEREHGSFQPGCAYYQLSKSEKVQHYKNLALRHRISGKIYTGPQVRQLLQIPDNTEIRLKPGDNKDYDIFIQSTSINRKLIADTDVLVVR